MKKLLFFSLFLFTTHNLSSMKEDNNNNNNVTENNIIEGFNNLNLDDLSIDAILEEKDLKTFVESLKQNKQLENKNQSGCTLLQIAVTEYIELETQIGQINHKLSIFFSSEAQLTSESFKYQKKLSNEFLNKKLLLSKCFTRIKLLLDAGAKIHTYNSQWKATTYKYTLFNPFCPPQISELFVCEKEKRVKNKKLKKELLKKEQENK